MSNVPLTLFLTIIASFIYLFSLWRGLREDYEIDHVFSLGFLSLIGLLIGFAIGKLIPEYWFWTTLSGFLIFFIIFVRRFKLRFYESLETSTPGLIALISVPFLAEIITSGSQSTSIFALFIILSFVLFLWLRKNYKRFTWYKSGKIGFASMSVFGLLFLFRIIAGFISPETVTMAGELDIVASAIVSFLSFFSLYNLSDI